MDIVHWIESHADVRVQISYLKRGKYFVIKMTDSDLETTFSKGLLKETLDRAKFTITDILDGMYEELKEYKNDGYLSDNGSAGASAIKSSGRI